MKPIPVRAFRSPERDRSYLLYCPEHGGWHVGEWWTVDGPGRWVLAYDVDVRLTATHVMDVPADPMDASGTLRWIIGRQFATAGVA